MTEAAKGGGGGGLPFEVRKKYCTSWSWFFFSQVLCFEPTGTLSGQIESTPCFFYSQILESNQLFPRGLTETNSDICKSWERIGKTLHRATTTTQNGSYKRFSSCSIQLETRITFVNKQSTLKKWICELAVLFLGAGHDPPARAMTKTLTCLTTTYRLSVWDTTKFIFDKNRTECRMGFSLDDGI